LSQKRVDIKVRDPQNHSGEKEGTPLIKGKEKVVPKYQGEKRETGVTQMCHSPIRTENTGN